MKIKRKKRKKNICNVIIGIILFISSIFIVYIFFFKKAFKIGKKKLKNITNNNSSIITRVKEIEISKETTVVNKTNIINVSNEKKINYPVYLIDDKLYWNIEKSINEEKVQEEIKKYDNISLSFENETDFMLRENPLISLVLTIYNQQEFIPRVYCSIQKQDLKI